MKTGFFVLNVIDDIFYFFFFSPLSHSQKSIYSPINLLLMLLVKTFFSSLSLCFYLFLLLAYKCILPFLVMCFACLLYKHLKKYRREKSCWQSRITRNQFFSSFAKACSNSCSNSSLTLLFFIYFLNLFHFFIVCVVMKVFVISSALNVIDINFLIILTWRSFFVHLNYAS